MLNRDFGLSRHVYPDFVYRFRRTELLSYIARYDALLDYFLRHLREILVDGYRQTLTRLEFSLTELKIQCSFLLDLWKNIPIFSSYSFNDGTIRRLELECFLNVF